MPSMGLQSASLERTNQPKEQRVSCRRGCFPLVPQGLLRPYYSSVTPDLARQDDPLRLCMFSAPGSGVLP